MKTLECIHCEAFFDCKGKPKPNDCMYYKENKDFPKPEFFDILQKEMGKNNGNK